MDSLIFTELIHLTDFFTDSKIYGLALSVTITGPVWCNVRLRVRNMDFEEQREGLEGPVCASHENQVEHTDQGH